MTLVQFVSQKPSERKTNIYLSFRQTRKQKQLSESKLTDEHSKR